MWRAGSVAALCGVAGRDATQYEPIAPTIAATIVDPPGHDSLGLAPWGRPSHFARADDLQVITVALAASLG